MEASIETISVRPTLVSYHFDLGNSTIGPVGYCARVIATSRDAAVGLLIARIEDFNSEYEVRTKDGPLEYLEVYFNARFLSEADIDDEDDVYCDFGSCNALAVQLERNGDCYCALHARDARG